MGGALSAWHLERQYDFPQWISAFFEAGEMFETDDGYQGSSPVYAKCPGVIEANPNKAEMQQRVRNCQETANKRFENWAILSTPYCHRLLEHQTVFGAIVFLTQLLLAENLLFQVDYND